MTWNYRVVRKEYKGFNEIEVGFAIHEVYYDDDGAPKMCTVNPTEPYGETYQELREDMVAYLRAFLEPVLEYDEIPWGRGDVEEFLNRE